MILAIAGGVIGDLLAIFLGFAAGLNHRLMSVGAVVFSSAFSMSALAGGIVAALLIGIAGGLMQAWPPLHVFRSSNRCVRRDAMQSLRLVFRYLI